MALVYEFSFRLRVSGVTLAKRSLIFHIERKRGAGSISFLSKKRKALTRWRKGFLYLESQA